MKLKYFKSVSSGYSVSFVIIMRYTMSAMLAALAMGIKWALSPIPNFEAATFLLMATVLWCSIGIAFWTINVFCFLNMLFFGVADWSIIYFVIFNLYALVILACRPMILRFWWTFIIIIAIMGYIFGSLYALETIALYGPAYALSYWISGFIFDFIHGTSNAIIGAALFWPTSRLFRLMGERYSFLFAKTSFKFWERIYDGKNTNDNGVQ